MPEQCLAAKESLLTVYQLIVNKFSTKVMLCHDKLIIEAKYEENHICNSNNIHKMQSTKKKCISLTFSCHQLKVKLTEVSNGLPGIGFASGV